MRKTILFFACCLLGWGASSSFAQQGTVSSGGTASGTGGTVTSTIGETNYINTTGSGGTITQGLQQPFEITTGIGDMNLPVELSLYPNPTNEYVILNVAERDFAGLSYQLYDMQGNILVNQKIEGSETNITMANYASATYFIKVVNSKNESKEFKIIKN
jgi:hypothetical protein